MGQFISKLRKENHLTQKELATALNITDKAVSKWERGLSCPDIALLSPIAEILGVTSTELLNCKRNVFSPQNVETDIETPLKYVEVNLENTLEYVEKSIKNKIKITQNIYSIAFSLIIFLGIFVSIICNLSISGRLTWSQYPICCCTFAWVVLFPTIKLGKKGVLYSLIALSIFILPFSLKLWNIIKFNSPNINIFTLFDVFKILNNLAIAVVVLLWIMYVLFFVLNINRLIASAISTLLIIPFNFIITYIVGSALNEPTFTPFNIIDTLALAMIAVALFVLNSVKKKKS